MKRTTTLLAGALVATLALAPAAEAKRGHGKQRSRTACGLVSEASTLPATIVIDLAGTRSVTIQNSTNVALPEGLAAGADVCAKYRRVRTVSEGTVTKTNVLKGVRVRPVAQVAAHGKADVSDDRSTVTVATIVFTVPAGMTLPASIVDDSVVHVRGKKATAEGTLDIVKIRQAKAAKPHMRRPGRRVVAPWVDIVGRVAGLTPATAEADGSVMVGGYALVIPKGKTLRPRFKDGALALARSRPSEDGTALVIKRTKVLQGAHVAPAPTT